MDRAALRLHLRRDDGTSLLLLLQPLANPAMQVGAWGWGSCSSLRELTPTSADPRLIADSDAQGRTPAFNFTLLLTSVFGILSAFAPTFPLLCLALFGLGTGVGGSMPTDGTLFVLPGIRRCVFADNISNTASWRTSRRRSTTSSPRSPPCAPFVFVRSLQEADTGSKLAASHLVRCSHRSWAWSSSRASAAPSTHSKAKCATSRSTTSAGATCSAVSGWLYVP